MGLLPRQTAKKRAARRAARIHRPKNNTTNSKIIARSTKRPPTSRRGGSGTPESTVEHRQNGRKNSLSRRFSPFWRGRLLLWGSWGRAAPKPCPAPRNAAFFCLRGHAPQSRPQIQARCKNQRRALVPKYTAPKPGPSGGLHNLPLPLVAQKGTYPGSASPAEKPPHSPSLCILAISAF